MNSYFVFSLLSFNLIHFNYFMHFYNFRSLIKPILYLKVNAFSLLWFSFTYLFSLGIFFNISSLIKLILCLKIIVCLDLILFILISIDVFVCLIDHVLILDCYSVDSPPIHRPMRLVIKNMWRKSGFRVLENRSPMRNDFVWSRQLLFIFEMGKIK